ncbi:hypothetical protein [Streptosporangium subroseum]|nr:hypothetical protein OHB15_00165 [Streptosporangium subroseum]
MTSTTQLLNVNHSTTDKHVPELTAADGAAVEPSTAGATLDARCLT